MSRRWTYKVAKMKPGFLGLKPELIEAEMQQWGRDGWELVSVKQMGAIAWLYFKKEM